MDPAERKLDQRIARRKDKVEKMILKQESIKSTLDPSDYLDHKEYMRDLSKAAHKLSRLKHELRILESGRLAQ